MTRPQLGCRSNLGASYTLDVGGQNSPRIWVPLRYWRVDSGLGNGAGLDQGGSAPSGEWTEVQCATRGGPRLRGRGQDSEHDRDCDEREGEANEEVHFFFLVSTPSGLPVRFVADRFPERKSVVAVLANATVWPMSALS